MNKKCLYSILFLSGILSACNSGSDAATSVKSSSTQGVSSAFKLSLESGVPGYDACLPVKTSYPCVGAGCTGPIPANLFTDGKAPGYNTNATMHPAQIISTNKYGYGRWVGVLKASDSLGADTSFFLFNNVGAEKTWPANWHEIDFEFNPGLRPDISNVMNGEFFDDGSRRLDRQLYLDSNNKITPLPTAANDSKYRDFVSLNTFAYDPDGKTNASNHQYMYLMNSSPYDDFHTYTIDYTPNGIWWEIDGKVISYSNDAVLNQPKEKWQNPTCDQFIHTTYMKVFRDQPELNMYINIWNGATPQAQYWTGSQQPEVGANAVYKSIKFYPLTNDKCGQAGQPACTESSVYQASPELSSDFKNNQYQLNGKNATFNDLWNVDDAYYQSLGGTFSKAGVVETAGTGLALNITAANNESITFNSDLGQQKVNIAYITKKSCQAGDPYIELGRLSYNGSGNSSTFQLPNDDIIGVLFSTMGGAEGPFYGACGLFPQNMQIVPGTYTATWTETFNPFGMGICNTTNTQPYFYKDGSKDNWTPASCPLLPKGIN